MADFSFSTDDLTSDDPAVFTAQINKSLLTGTNIKSSRSVLAQQTGDLDSTAQMSTLTVGQIMMGSALFDDPADVIAKQQDLMSTLVGAANNSESTNSLGVFNALVPTDLQSQAATAAAGDTSGSAGPATTPAGAAPGTGGTDPQASTDGQALVANPNVHFQSTAGGALAKSDIAAGRINPTIIFVLAVLAAQLDFTISCAASDLAGHRNQGHAAGSLHYQYDAVDVVDLKDLATGYSIHIQNKPTDPLIRKALDIINTITGPRRPDQIISYINTGYPGFTAQADHASHIHIGTHKWGAPSATTSYDASHSIAN